MSVHELDEKPTDDQLLRAIAFSLDVLNEKLSEIGARLEAE